MRRRHRLDGPRSVSVGIKINGALLLTSWKGPRNQHHRTRLAFVDFTHRSGAAPCGCSIGGDVAVFCAVGGVQPVGNGLAAGRSAYKCRAHVFVNKMDRTGAIFLRSRPDQGSPERANKLPIQPSRSAAEGDLKDSSIW